MTFFSEQDYCGLGHDCHHQAECKNGIFSYSCHCQSGFQVKMVCFHYCYPIVSLSHNIKAKDILTPNSISISSDYQRVRDALKDYSASLSALHCTDPNSGSW